MGDWTPELTTALNNEPTRLTVEKPKDAIKAPRVAQKHSSVVAGRPIGLEKTLNFVSVFWTRSLSVSAGRVGGGRRRATDPVWSLTIHIVRNVVRQTGQPALYYLSKGPTRGFVREVLLIIPPDTELPPDQVLAHPTAR